MTFAPQYFVNHIFAGTSYPFSVIGLIKFCIQIHFRVDLFKFFSSQCQAQWSMSITVTFQFLVLMTIQSFILKIMYCFLILLNRLLKLLTSRKFVAGPTHVHNAVVFLGPKNCNIIQFMEKSNYVFEALLQKRVKIWQKLHNFPISTNEHFWSQIKQCDACLSNNRSIVIDFENKKFTFVELKISDSKRMCYVSNCGKVNFTIYIHELICKVILDC